MAETPIARLKRILREKAAADRGTYVSPTTPQDHGGDRL